jgi:hypothetical protein
MAEESRFVNQTSNMKMRLAQAKPMAGKALPWPLSSH